jgi:glycosyltransferase involved in cell wall biosynthesis
LRIAYLSSYPPRECGIANFTKDLIEATMDLDGVSPCVLAVNEKGAIYDYERRVKLNIDRDEVDDYIKAAEYVNASNIQLLVVQHEFGLFGGSYGDYLRIFLERIKIPIITTLHTVQPDFDEKAIGILKWLSERSSALVVIAHSAIDILKKQGIHCAKCFVIPHGCPNIEQANKEPIKEALGLKGRLVVSTFGLINSGKGIEFAIKALPEAIRKDQRIIYLVIGETHPEVRKNEGEKYRNELQKMVCDLKLSRHVRFTNRFLSKRELIKYLQATDIYITPYISPNQISSGTLTYALGAGKAIVSTPYFHAQEVLADDRGILCEFKDSTSIARGIDKFLDEEFRKQVEKRVYEYSRQFLWKNVARKYLKVINAILKKY